MRHMCFAVGVLISTIQPTWSQITWSLDADSVSAFQATSSGSADVDATLLGFGEISNRSNFCVGVARVGSALQFGVTQAMTATLPSSYDLAAGTLEFWFQPRGWDSSTTTLGHDLIILGPNTYTAGRVHIFNNREYV